MKGTVSQKIADRELTIAGFAGPREKKLGAEPVHRRGSFDKLRTGFKDAEEEYKFQSRQPQIYADSHRSKDQNEFPICVYLRKSAAKIL
jgi:hypothetical protein